MVLLLGRMFPQCFFQFGIDEILEGSDYRGFSKKQKLWVSSVVLGEGCSDPQINEAANFVRAIIERYLIAHAPRLMEKAAKKVQENFLGESE